MKFLLVGEDQSMGSQLVIGIVEDSSKEEIVGRFQLKEFPKTRDALTDGLRDRDRKIYWFGNMGDVMIYIYKIAEGEISNMSAFEERIKFLHCQFY